MTIRLLIVDDHAVVRAGMKMLLQSDAEIRVIGEAENGEEALRLARELEPDVIVMDITMPGMNGTEATRKIKAEFPDIAILALTIHEGTEYFFQMLQAGASGYVPKRVATDDLLRGIHIVARGDVFLEPGIARELVEDYLGRVKDGQEHDSYNELTPREQEVLTLIAEGLSNRDIAEKLVISVKTVDRHRENMMNKLNLHNRTELVKYAIRRGMIQLKDDE